MIKMLKLNYKYKIINPHSNYKKNSLKMANYINSMEPSGHGIYCQYHNLIINRWIINPILIQPINQLLHNHLHKILYSNHH